MTETNVYNNIEYRYVHLKSDEYFNMDSIENRPYFLIGGRRTGKSFFIKHYVYDLLKNSDFKRKFMYVRVDNTEIRTANSWIAETPILNHYFGYDNVNITRGKPHANDISVVFGDKKNEYVHIGYGVSLEKSSTIKSAVFQDVDCIIFEEFIRYGMTSKKINDYVFNFLELLETVKRGRQFPIFFIANAINGYNPLISKLKNAVVYKITSDERPSDIIDKGFKGYLEGDVFENVIINLNDYKYLTKIKISDKTLFLYVNKFKPKTFYLTIKKNNKDDDVKTLALLKGFLLVNNYANIYHFNDVDTEQFFYENEDEYYKKLRNKYNILEKEFGSFDVFLK